MNQLIYKMVYCADATDQVRRLSLLGEMKESRSKEVCVCLCVCLCLQRGFTEIITV